MTTNNDDMFADAARDVLADQCTPQVVRAIEHGGRGAAATTALWQQLEATGLTISAKSMDDLLVEMVEWPQHPWFIACQAHPEFLSTPRGGHPLFVGFIRAAREKKHGGKLPDESGLEAAA